MAVQKMKTINKERLVWARNYYGLDTQTVSAKTKIAETKLQDFESGADFPTYSELEKLSEAYNQPVLFFFYPKPPKSQFLSAEFRALEKSSSRVLTLKRRELIEKADVYILNLEELFASETRPSFSDLITEEKISTSEQLISWLRDKVELSIEVQVKTNSADKLLEYLREKLFKIGLYVFKDSFQDNDVSGLCLYDKHYPVILLNNKMSFPRQLFTLFHEIYHIYLKVNDMDFAHSNLESKCNKFASDFLIPSDDLNIQISQYSDYEDDKLICDLALRYCVSKDAVAYRLKSLGLIGDQFYSNYHTTYTREATDKSSGGNFYFTKISYLGKSYLSNVFEKYYAGKLTITQVSQLSFTKASLVQSLDSSLFRRFNQ